MFTNIDTSAILVISKVLGAEHVTPSPGLLPPTVPQNNTPPHHLLPDALNRPEFRAYFLSWEGWHVSMPVRYDQDTNAIGYPAGARARRRLHVGVRGDHRGGPAAGDDPGDAAQVDPPGRRR